MKLLLFLLLPLVFLTCNNDTEPETTGFPVIQDPTPGINQDSIDLIHKERMAGYKTLKIDNVTKCNLITGYFLLGSTPIDSSDLYFMAKHLADSLFQSSKKEVNCNYKKMAAAHIYLIKTEFEDYEGNSIASCTITPSNYSGEINVDTYRLKKRKK